MMAAHITIYGTTLVVFGSLARAVGLPTGVVQRLCDSLHSLVSEKGKKKEKNEKKISKIGPRVWAGAPAINPSTTATVRLAAGTGRSAAGAFEPTNIRIYICIIYVSVFT